MADVTDQTEVEWQFDAPDRAALRWLDGAKVPGYTVDPTGTKDVSDTYLDTADWRLHRAGFTCRVRRKAAGSELTLKSMAEAQGGLRSRRELTEQLAVESPLDLAGATGAGGRTLAIIIGNHPLVHLFTLRQAREIYRLADAAGEIGEISVDDTRVLDALDAELARLSRVEVEVEAGATARAQRFVDLLVATASLEPATQSKFEAGLAATGLQPRAFVPSGEIVPRAGMTTAEAAFAVMRKQFAVMLANEASTRLGEDIEGLHDMRVATRRLRAAMQAFRPWLPVWMERLRAEFGWVADALGTVRDLDVQIERMEEWRSGHGTDAVALDAIEALLEARRQPARRRMLAVLDSKRYDRLIARFEALLHRGPPRSLAAGRAPLLETAPGLLEKRYRRVRKLGDAIGRHSPPEEYHALRIEAKKLRYALEFVGPVYGRQATEFAQRLTALQDLLGLHQDAEVAVTMLHEMAEANARRLGPRTVLAMGAIAERYRKHAQELRDGFPPLYRGIRGDEWRALHRTVEARRKQSDMATRMPPEKP